MSSFAKNTNNKINKTPFNIINSYKQQILINDIKKSLSKRYNFEDFIKDKNIKQIFISDSLIHLKDRIMKKFNLKEYNNKNEICIFFGVYGKENINKINSHVGEKYIMYGGSDANNCVKFKENNNISISKDIYNRLLVNNVNSILLYFNLVDKKLFRPIRNITGKKIFIYDGIRKKSDNRVIYDLDTVEKVVKKLPNYEYIYSSDLNLPNNKMPDIYKECFIGLRLTPKDGNANMVQEMEAMEIPVIHNQSEYGLKWKDINDIKNWIDFFDPNLNIDMFYLNSLTSDIIDKVKNNIDNFDNKISKFKNILFISGDYPSYGGAATNCYNLAKYYRNKGHKTFSFYYHFENDSKYEEKKRYMIGNLNNIKNINFKPDLIILKSFVNYDLKKFNCPIIYLVGGIYHNHLDKYYYDIEKKELDNYINKSVIKQIYNSTLTFVNSHHTQILLKKHYNINTHLFYSSFVPFKNHKIIDDVNFENRKYDYGLIISNFNREIKNINKSINFLKNKKNVILIGKHSDKYKKHGFKCIDLIDSNIMSDYYKQIKYIVQHSFYESCSNVKIEGLFYGCKIIS